MNRRLAAIALGCFLVVCLAALTYWGLSRLDTGGDPAATDAGAALEVLVEAGEAVLYFPGRGGKLYPERRLLANESVGEARLRLIVEQLLAGPEGKGLLPALPPHVELSDLTLAANGTLFLDLSSKEGALRGLGSTSEVLAIYSLVDTVLLNEPRAQSVVLLWNGRQQPSLAGHVDTTRPFTANRRLIAEST